MSRKSVLPGRAAGAGSAALTAPLSRCRCMGFLVAEKPLECDREPAAGRVRIHPDQPQGEAHDPKTRVRPLRCARAALDSLRGSAERLLTFFLHPFPPLTLAVQLHKSERIFFVLKAVSPPPGTKTTSYPGAC